MKSVPILRVSRAIPVFSRIFPHKLKYKMFGPSIVKKNLLQVGVLNGTQCGVRKFSTRAGRRIEVSKSLIEDEAELSDLVSGLSSSSFKKTRVYSDAENYEDDANVESGRHRITERDRKRQRGGKLVNGFVQERKYESHSNSMLLDRRSMSRDSSGFLAMRDGDKFERRLKEKSKKSAGFLSKGNGLDSARYEWVNDGSRQKRPEMRNGTEGKFRGQLEENNMRKDGLFDRRINLNGRKRLRSNEEEREKRKEMWNRRNGGGDDGALGMKRGRRGTERGGITLNDGDEEGEFEKGCMNFKEIDSDENDDDDEEVVNEAEEEDGEEEYELFSKGNGFSQSQGSSPGKSDSYLSKSRFDQCSISPLSLKGIKDAGFEHMTLVQEATLPAILKGKDVMAKAKTGTGKTVAFLLPAIELVLQSPPVSRDQKRPPILVLVICPTRELANQATAEASTLLKYHPSIGVQVVIGGTRLALEQKRMQAKPCQILVATPGRLRDHVENTAGFATRLMGVKILVLDEADHLLDMGFRKEIEKIVNAVPKQRQTLLFSATIPQEVRQICHIALKRDHEFINTVQEGSEDTHSQVRQMHLVAPLDKHFSLLYSLIKDHIADDVNYKILVFCTTAMMTKLVAELLSVLRLNVREIHSRKPQSYRTRVSDEFRKSKGLILVTSDVSARGVDYPDVTLVVQIGVPADREQYIHRLGRTGRKGKEGEGVLVLAPWEEFFLTSVKDLPIAKASEPVVDPDTRKKVEHSLLHVEMKSKEAAYQAWLGYYNSNKIVGRDKHRLIELANEFSRSMGLYTPPAIPKLVLGKMGLKNIPGLRSK